MRRIVELLMMVAVLLLPFGMAAAPAAVGQHHAAASMAMPNCPDQAPHHGSKAAFHECTMACSAALPAVDFSARQPLLIVCSPGEPGVVQHLEDLHPETATPPPKRS
jgi:hypothetical protein